ncbi:insulinase family protein [Aggregatimonas sangjinii]|uniref:Insulinase family protein n=1 Tax=Aggregatimonas sangjinii TaxID=2583587 RepID=A0A5B7SSL5_9FLAO|nr:pitrilysin family protein [Aggregatimonas sangjinii]QCX01517.1 insulinase family protein [Aggregatimonas sangjinii]
MKSNFLLSCLAALVFNGVLLGQMTKTASVEGITEYQMDNGLKVLLFPDNSAQTITVNITYLVGSRHEGYGEKGMAHLLEHMVFKGTPNHPDIPKELSSHGARPNGTTWYDRTNYFETFNATDENLEWALDLEADRMVNSFIAKKDLDSEFSVVRNEFESGENDPTGVLMEKTIDAAYLWHNYGKSTIGNRSDIERVPIENLKAFYKAFYRPDNAVLMVTGKFDPEKTMKLIEEKFGKLEKPATPIRQSYTEEPAQDGEKTVSVSRTGDLQLVSALYHTPAGSDVDYAAMAIVENVLTDEPSGRLYKALVESKKASSLWSFSPFTKEPGFLYINVDVPSEKDADEVNKTLRETLDALKDNPITQEELDRAKSNIAKRIDQISRNSAYLGTYMSEFIGAGDWRLAFIYRDRVEEMSLEDVNAAMTKYLIPTNRTMGRFYPTKTPVRVEIGHTQDLDKLVADYKGKEGMGTGEAFDVAHDAIQERLKTGQLANGVDYGFIEKNNRGNTVTLSFSGRNGDVNSLMNKGVVPSFTANMLNKGTTEKTRQEIEDELAKLKSSINFRGGNGNIYANISTKEEDLMPTLELMAHMLKNPAFDAAELEKLKTEELAQIESYKNEPQFIASNKVRLINNTYPKGHPNYTMGIEERVAAIKALTIDDIKKFYNEFYGLGKSILVGIGNVDAEAVGAFIEKEFGNFDSNMAYEQIANPYKANKAVNEDVITPDKQNAMTFGALGVEMSEYSDDYPAMNIAATILGGGFLNSRIADRLRQKDGVSYGAGAGFQADGNKEDANSGMYLYAIYAPANYDKVQLGFKEEIARFIKDGITEEELKNAVNGWIQAQSVSRAKDNELSSLINNNIFYDRDMDFQKELEEKVSKLTVADVNAAIKKYVQPYEKWTVVNAGDFKKE